MKKIAVLAIIILLLSTISSLFCFEIVEGNGFPVSDWNITQIPVPDGSGSVIISVDSPKNCSSFKTNNITLSFTASSPDPVPTPNVVENYVTFDIWSDWFDFVPIYPVYGAGVNAAMRANVSITDRSGSDYNPSVNVTLTNIPEGFHNLTIRYHRTYFTAYSRHSGSPNLNATCYILEASSTIFFTISPEGSDNSSADVFQGYLVPVVAIIATLIVVAILSAVWQRKTKGEGGLSESNKLSHVGFCSARGFSLNQPAAFGRR
jgi:hypothetical protein